MGRCLLYGAQVYAEILSANAPVAKHGSYVVLANGRLFSAFA